MAQRDTPPTFDAATEQRLTDAATVTPEDVDRAALAWDQHAPAPFRSILDAEHSDG
jgi:hypothetical protein